MNYGLGWSHWNFQYDQHVGVLDSTIYAALAQCWEVRNGPVHFEMSWPTPNDAENVVYAELFYEEQKDFGAEPYLKIDQLVEGVRYPLIAVQLKFEWELSDNGNIENGPDPVQYASMYIRVWQQVAISESVWNSVIAEGIKTAIKENRIPDYIKMQEEAESEL